MWSADPRELIGLKVDRSKLINDLISLAAIGIS